MELPLEIYITTSMVFIEFIVSYRDFEDSGVTFIVITVLLVNSIQGKTGIYQNFAQFA